jgi:hypothetical protein
MVNLLPGKDAANYVTLSRKPPRGHYEDYYEQFTAYVALLLTPAQTAPDRGGGTQQPGYGG